MTVNWPAILLSVNIVLALCSISDAEQEGPYTYTVSTNSEAVITDFSEGFSGSLSITNVLGGYPVTDIGAYAFHSCYGLTSVTIPDSVTIIGHNSFHFCDGLTNVVIDNGVTNIGAYAAAGARAQVFSDKP